MEPTGSPGAVVHEPKPAASRDSRHFRGYSLFFILNRDAWPRSTSAKWRATRLAFRWACAQFCPAHYRIGEVRHTLLQRTGIKRIKYRFSFPVYRRELRRIIETVLRLVPLAGFPDRRTGSIGLFTRHNTHVRLPAFGHQNALTGPVHLVTEFGQLRLSFEHTNPLHTDIIRDYKLVGNITCHKGRQQYDNLDKPPDTHLSVFSFFIELAFRLWRSPVHHLPMASSACDVTRYAIAEPGTLPDRGAISRVDMFWHKLNEDRSITDNESR